MTTKKTNTAKTTTTTDQKDTKTMTNGTDLVPAQTSAQALEALGNIDRYLEATAAESAQYLKHTKGHFYYGMDEEELEVGTELALNAASIEAGHVRFFDGKVTDENMMPVCKGMFTPREELGDLDREL